MSSATLKQFVEDVMGINAGYPGMGTASTAIIGASGTNDAVVHRFRKDVIAFATERAKSTPDQARLDQRAQQLHGSLLSLKLINAISEKRLNELASSLDVLSASVRS
jgi:hypothetical protein